MLNTLPARLTKGFERLLETRRGGDLALMPMAGLTITSPVQRRHHFSAKPRVLLEHRFCRFGRGILTAGQLADLR